jgi:pre-rRNA-processing protein TSR2
VFEETTPTPDDQYIEELLLQVMADEFDVLIEDGSAESVANDIVGIWEETRVGNQNLVLKFERLVDELKGKKVDVQEVQEGNGGDGTDDDGELEDDDDDDEDMSVGDGEEPPQLLQHPESGLQKNEPEVDEDGFTLVKGKGKR